LFILIQMISHLFCSYFRKNHSLVVQFSKINFLFINRRFTSATTSIIYHTALYSVKLFFRNLYRLFFAFRQACLPFKGAINNVTYQHNTRQLFITNNFTTNKSNTPGKPNNVTVPIVTGFKGIYTEDINPEKLIKYIATEARIKCVANTVSHLSSSFLFINSTNSIHEDINNIHNKINFTFRIPPSSLIYV
ncbi:hypothetical protein, partial [Paenibacillus sp. CMAA1364]